MILLTRGVVCARASQPQARERDQPLQRCCRLAEGLDGALKELVGGITLLTNRQASFTTRVGECVFLLDVKSTRVSSVYDNKHPALRAAHSLAQPSCNKLCSAIGSSVRGAARVSIYSPAIAVAVCVFPVRLSDG